LQPKLTPLTHPLFTTVNKMVNLTNWLHGDDLLSSSSSPTSSLPPPNLASSANSKNEMGWEYNFSDSESDGTVNTDDEWVGGRREEEEEEGYWCNEDEGEVRI